MFALVKREINGFFNSLIAYVVIAVFLLINSLFLWVFPLGYNIPDAGYANLDGLFTLAPFVFLFLVPAITMRFFAEELRTGTIEMLITKPISLMQIVVAKYIAGVVLVVVALLPTLIFFSTVQYYAAPPGVDTGAVWGSYTGLLFLGIVFVAIGLFASALSDNQILAFIIGLFACGFVFIGFEMVHSLEVFGKLDLFIRNLGLYAHYTSMGRGVIDSRDVIYFLSVIVFFLAATVHISEVKLLKRRALAPLLTVLLVIVALNLLSPVWFARIDLTSEKRYSLTRATRDILRNIDDIVYFRVYLEGDLPAEFRKLRNDTREMLDEFSARSDKIQYEFISPSRAAGDNHQQLQQYYRMLTDKGLEPAQVQMRAGDGASQRVVFPGALVSYKGKEIPLQLLTEHIGLPLRQVLHNASIALEYKLASSILQITKTEKERIAFMEGHGELDARYVASITRDLESYYDVDRVNISDGFETISRYKTLISAKPRKPFSEKDKFVLDQFLMHGGSMLWLVNPVFADMDSLMVADETIGMSWDINMDDFFFRYGARLNPVLLKDLHAAPIPVTTGFVAGQPRINLLPWNFFPLIIPLSDHEIVNNLNTIRSEFISSIDTVEAPGIQKTVLLETSPYTRIMRVPVRISLDMLERPVNEALYSGPPQTVAVLLEGSFESLYRNRIAPEIEMPAGFERRDQGKPAAIILVSGADIIRNQFGSDGRALPTGYDRFSGQQFGNQDFILNAVNYLSDDSGIISARAKDIRLRILDQQRLKNNLTRVQLLNTLLPVLIVMGFGSLRLIWRKRQYAK